ncbi:hypothetical protein ACP4OV_006635 [Aristida adscensionis]
MSQEYPTVFQEAVNKKLAEAEQIIKAANPNVEVFKKLYIGDAVPKKGEPGKVTVIVFLTAHNVVQEPAPRIIESE